MIETQTTNQPPPPVASQGNTPPLKTALQQLDAIRDALRVVTGGLNDLVKTLAQAQRNKRNTEKEIESIRDSLRSLQKVRI
jgi:ABC-type transporter Mla subunit MlaD